MSLPPFGTSRVLMSTNHRAIHMMRVPFDLPRGVGPLLHRCEHSLPVARFPPAIEPIGDGFPEAIATGYISPRGTSRINPQDCIDDAPMIMIGMPFASTTLRWLEITQ